MKCKKCGIRFKDRLDNEEKVYTQDCCWNCKFILDCICMTVISLGLSNVYMSKSLNREVSINLDAVKIKKNGNR